MKENPLNSKTKKEIRSLLENWMDISTKTAIRKCQN